MSINRIEKALKEALDEALNRDSFQRVMNEAANIVRVRTRVGFGV